MLEYWVSKAKNAYSQNIVETTFIYDTHPISILFDSKSIAHYSTIPTFHHSNWFKAPNLANI